MDETTMGKLLSDDDQLLQFGFRFLKQVLFGEESIPVSEKGRHRRREARREHIANKRKAETAAHKAHDPRDDAAAEDR